MIGHYTPNSWHNPPLQDRLPSLTPPNFEAQAKVLAQYYSDPKYNLEPEEIRAYQLLCQNKSSPKTTNNIAGRPPLPQSRVTKISSPAESRKPSLSRKQTSDSYNYILSPTTSPPTTISPQKLLNQSNHTKASSLAFSDQYLRSASQKLNRAVNLIQRTLGQIDGLRQHSQDSIYHNMGRNLLLQGDSWPAAGSSLNDQKNQSGDIFLKPVSRTQNHHRNGSSSSVPKSLQESKKNAGMQQQSKNRRTEKNSNDFREYSNNNMKQIRFSSKNHHQPESPMPSDSSGRVKWGSQEVMMAEDRSTIESLEKEMRRLLMLSRQFENGTPQKQQIRLKMAEVSEKLKRLRTNRYSQSTS